MNVWTSAWKYLVDEPAGRYHWERRNLLAASALRSAAWVAWRTAWLCLSAYAIGVEFFGFSWLWVPAVAFLAVTAAIHYRSFRKEPHPL